MKTKSILGLVALLALVAMPNVMMAAPACANSGSLSDLIALGSTGCTVDGGAITFANFASTPEGVPIPDADVSFTNLGMGNGSFEPSGTTVYGFNFNPSMYVALTGTGSVDLDIQYTVTTATPILDSVAVGVTADFGNGVVGSGTVSETDYGCPALSGGTGCDTLGPPTPLRVSEPGVPAFADYNGVGPYSEILVNTKDINLTVSSCPATGACDADISSVIDGVDIKAPVPEPTTVAYVGVGLLALIEAARRRRMAK